MSINVQASEASALLPLGFEEGCYSARVLDGACSGEVEAFERLRFGYFVRQRGWVAEDAAHPGRERDRYDEAARHLAVFRYGRMVAYLRALPWQMQPGFMLEDEFRCLLPEGTPVVHEDAVELTRLVVAPPDELERSEARAATQMLFKLLYLQALRDRWSHLYIVVERPWLPLFSRRFGLRFEPLGCPRTFPDGTETTAALARLCDLESGLSVRNPEKLRWYRAV